MLDPFGSPPGLPPVATMYTWLLPPEIAFPLASNPQAYLPVMLNAPPAPLVTGEVSIGMAAVPLPPLPTVYSWMVDPTTPCWPP